MGLQAPFARDLPLVPAHYIGKFTCFMQRNGVAPSVLLDGSGIAATQLEHTDTWVSVNQVVAVISRAVELDRRPGLGFSFGRELDLASHGLLGFSILRRERLRELVVMAVNFLRVRLPLMELRLVEQGDCLSLAVEQTWDLGRAHRFISELYAGSALELCRLATLSVSLDLTGPRPSDDRLYRGIRGTELNWDAPATQLRLNFRGKPGWREPEALGQTLFAGLGLRPAPRQDDQDQEIVLRTRHAIVSEPGRDCTLENVAAQLNMSARSLRRHLQDAGQNFSDIRNAIRRELAMRLLRGTTLSLDTIADRLGYGDQASFSKAFSAWTGVAPGRYRRGDRPAASFDMPHSTVSMG